MVSRFNTSSYHLNKGFTGNDVQDEQERPAEDINPAAPTPAATAISLFPSVSTSSVPASPSAPSAPSGHSTAADPPASPRPQSVHRDAPSQPDSRRQRRPQVDDFKLEHHPGAQKQTVIYPFEEYRQTRPETDFEATMDEPWHPFETRGDFELAEIVHESRMSRGATQRLLKLIQDIRRGEAELTFSNESDLRTAWDNASIAYPTVCV